MMRPRPPVCLPAGRQAFCAHVHVHLPAGRRSLYSISDRMRKLRIISIVTLFILFIFITKDYVLKACIKHYIGKELNGRCKIDKAQVLFNGINIEGFKLSSQSLEFTLGQGNVEVGFPEILKPRIYRVTLRDARLTIKNLESTKDM